MNNFKSSTIDLVPQMPNKKYMDIINHTKSLHQTSKGGHAHKTMKGNEFTQNHHKKRHSRLTHTLFQQLRYNYILQLHTPRTYVF